MQLQTRTLQELFSHRAKQDDVWLICPHDPCEDSSASRLSFREILEAATHVGSALRELGAEPGWHIGLLAENGPVFAILFLGIVHQGMVPIPLPVPLLASESRQYAEHLSGMLREANARILLTEDKLAGLGNQLSEKELKVIQYRTLVTAKKNVEMVSASPHDVALVQYTSGSTRTPRGAVLTHHNILSNVHAIGVRLGSDEGRVALCWLPLFHDMGLTGTLLHSFYWGHPLVLMKTVDFVRRPSSWLWAVSRFGVTGCAAPNFAYSLCSSRERVPESQLEGLDLSTWCHAMIGAESVQKATLDAFAERYASYGFSRSAFVPAYGLAENTVACCLHTPGTYAKIDRVDRTALETSADARLIDTDENERTRELVGVGAPIEGNEIRIILDNGDTAYERQAGEIQVRGPSTMKGYVGERASPNALISDGWLRTGDIGYLVGGSLFVVGRIQDVINRGGVKYDAVDIQVAVSQVPGTRPGCVAAFGRRSSSGTEDLVVVAETRLVQEEDLKTLRLNIAKQVRANFLCTPDLIALVPPGVVPKSSSGKVANSECRRRLERSELVVL